MFEWNAIDLHTHTVVGVTRDKGKDNVNFSYQLFQKAISDHDLKLVAPTNHNVIDLANYLLMKYVGEIQDCNVLLGVELDSTLSMGSPIHIAAIVEQDLLKNIDLANYINSTTEKKKNSEDAEIIYKDSEIVDLFIDNNLLLIPHGDKDRGIFRDAGPEKVEEALKKIQEGFFRICDSRSNWKLEQVKKVIFEMDENSLDDFGGVLFSDNRDWNNYDKFFRDFYMNAEPTFQGLIHAISNPTKRFCLRKEIKRNNNYISKIVFMNKNANSQILQGEICLSPYLNCVIGKSGSGKSLLKHMVEKKLDRNPMENEDYAFADNTEVKIYNENGIELDCNNINITVGKNIYAEIIKATTSKENEDLYSIAKDLNPDFESKEKFNLYISSYKKRIDEYCDLSNGIKGDKILLTQKIVNFNSNVNKLKNLSAVSVFPVKSIPEKNNMYTSEEVERFGKADLTEFIKEIEIYKGKYKVDLVKKISELREIVNLAKLDMKTVYYEDLLENKKVNVFNKAVNAVNTRISSQAFEKSKITLAIPSDIEEIVSLVKKIYLSEIKESVFDLSINLDEINSRKGINVDQSVVVEEVIPEEELKNISEKENKIFSTHGKKGHLTNRIYNLLDINDSKSLIKKYLEIGVIDESGNWSFKSTFEPETTIFFDGNDVKKLNPGSIAKKYIEVYFNDRVMNDKYSLVLFDQIENDVDKPFIAGPIKELLEKTKGYTQTIVITHDPIVAVNADPNNYIECTKTENGIIYRNFVAESQLKDELKTISEIVDGSKSVIKKRYEIYEGENV